MYLHSLIRFSDAHSTNGHLKKIIRIVSQYGVIFLYMYESILKVKNKKI